MQSRRTRFWYRFKNWFRFREGPGEPHRFLCGSEEELRRVTTWVCHLNPDVFAEQNEVVFWYTSPCEGWEPTESRYVVRGASEATRIYLNNWGAFIHKHNRFTGTVWTHCIMTDDGTKPAPGLHRCYEEPGLYTVRVHPPSFHERAESLLSLSEWLDGKVSEEEKRELLQLPEAVEL